METYKTLTLDTDKKLCIIDDKEISLTKNEFNTLELLMQNRDKILSRTELIQGDSNERTVDALIVRLRKKLLDYGSNIITRRGFGYGFFG